MTCKCVLVTGALKVGSYIKMDLGSGENDVHYVDAAQEMSSSFEDLTTSEKSFIWSNRTGFWYGFDATLWWNNSLFDTQSSGPQTSKAFFSIDGKSVAETASAEFAAAGKYHVAPSRFVKLPDSSFAVDFGTSPWDCSGGTEVDMSSVEMETSGANSCFRKYGSSSF